MYRISTLNTKLLPSSQEFIAATLKADADLENRDTKPLMAYCKRLSVVDSRVRSHIRIRKVGVSAFTWAITATDKKNQVLADKAKDSCRHIINKILKYHTDTPIYGASVIQIKWDLDASGAYTPIFKKRYDPVEIIWDKDAENLLLEPKGDRSAQFNIPQYPDKTRYDYLIDTDEGDEPGGALRAIVPHAILKYDNLREWGNYNSLLKGLITAAIDDSTDADTVKDATSILASLATKRTGVVSKDIDINFKDLTASAGFQSFQEIIANSNAEFAVAILGEANTTELPSNGGSRAALEVLKSIGSDIIFDDLTRISQLINDQLLSFYWALNKGAIVPPFEFKFNENDDYSLDERVNAVEVLKRSGIPLNSDEVYKMTGFTKPEGSPDVFVASKEPGL